MKNLSLALGRLEAERNDFVSTLFQGSAGAQSFFRQEEQLGMLLTELDGLQRVEVDQMQRLETAKKRGAMHRSVNNNLKKQVSISSISSGSSSSSSSSPRYFFTTSSRPGDLGRSLLVFKIQVLNTPRQVPGICFIRDIPGKI